MSKAEKLRELDSRVNELESENARLREKLAEYQKRDKRTIGDCVVGSRFSMESDGSHTG